MTCQNERSQGRNREMAMRVLKARLYQKALDERRAEEEKRVGEKKSIEWGSQIRSYVLHPYRMVKDHRTGFESGDTDRVLDGGLTPFVEAYLKSAADGQPRPCLLLTPAARRRASPWMDEVRARLAARERSAPSRPAGQRRAGVLVPLFVRDGALWVLLTRRTESVEHHRGQISFPGGAEEEDDEIAATRTALRETEEEIGVAAGRRPLPRRAFAADDGHGLLRRAVTSAAIPHPYPFRPARRPRSPSSSRFRSPAAARSRRRSRRDSSRSARSRSSSTTTAST